MKHKFLRLIALVLCCVMLSGCSALTEYWKAIGATFGYRSSEIVPYSEMTYTRPDMTLLTNTLSDACNAAAGEELEPIINKIWAFYDAYDLFYTQYSLADIRYSGDLTDTYWETEYNFCAENSPRVDAMLEELYYALAKSPCLEELESEEYFGAGYFDSYQGENNWDEELTALMEEESALVSRYYALSAPSEEYESGSEEFYEAKFEEMAQVLVELNLLRREIAAYWGYDNYNQFATDFYHYRDYTVAEAQDYSDQIREELVDIYCQVNMSGIWEDGFHYSTETETYAYVREMAEKMGGTVSEAFQLMDQAGLYDIAYGENKYPSSFEIYLTSYYEPFIFMCPSLSTYDHLTFAHEFGHFCNDYASYGSYAGVDVLEFFSQGMEYLSLCYVDDTEQLTKMKMADSLCLYVEQSAFASFEMQMYEIPEEELTADALLALYEQVALEYGFESVGYDPREFVTINHYYTNPLYILSYVVSNDAAMQLYQLEQETPGAGLAIFEENLTTEEYYLHSFLESAGLESPFAEGRLKTVRETFETIFE
jgi:hypothetical protein